MRRSQPLGLLDKPDGNRGGNIMHPIPLAGAKGGRPAAPLARAARLMLSHQFRSRSLASRISCKKNQLPRSVPTITAFLNFCAKVKREIATISRDPLVGRYITVTFGHITKLQQDLIARRKPITRYYTHSLRTGPELTQ